MQKVMQKTKRLEAKFMAHLFVYAMLCLIFTGLNFVYEMFPRICDMTGIESWIQARSEEGVNINFPCCIKVQV